MFKHGSVTRPMVVLLTGLVLALLSGCKHYRADVVVNPDGSGTRTVTLTWESGSEESIRPASDTFRELFGVTAAAGWTPMENDEGKLRGYRRTTAPADPDGWMAASGDLHVRGTVEPGESGLVEFANTVRLNRTDDGAGFEYRETFAWTGLLEVFIGFHTRALERRLPAAFPALDAEERAELKGMFSGLMTTWLLLMDIDQDSELEAEDMARVFVDLAGASLLENHPDLDRERLTGFMLTLFDDTEDELDTYLEEHLPGAHLTVFSDIEVRLTLPGPIGDGNADRVEGSTATWTVNIWDALARPREIWARSAAAP